MQVVVSSTNFILDSSIYFFLNSLYNTWQVDTLWQLQVGKKMVKELAKTQKGEDMMIASILNSEVNVQL